MRNQSAMLALQLVVLPSLRRNWWFCHPCAAAGGSAMLAPQLVVLPCLRCSWWFCHACAAAGGSAILAPQLYPLPCLYLNLAGALNIYLVPLSKLLYCCAVTQ